MKLSVLTVPLYDRNLEEALKTLSELGVQQVELGAGGYPGNTHLNPAELLNNPQKQEELHNLLKKYNMEISAISCHANPVHPQKDVAETANKEIEDAILLAEQLKVDTIVTFSGCPGDSDGSKYPNWVTCPWPEDFIHILNYQWEEKLIPYWKKACAFANAHGVHKIALEMHPGFCVYNPETLLKLRAAVGETIGANFDPSHLYWQGIEPTAAIKALKGAIYHFHAKDTAIDQRNTDVNGVLDTKHYGNIPERSWVFRTIGYGHDLKTWKDIISTLKFVGYDGAISIEHEDGLMSITEGLTKAITLLKDVIIFESAGEMWWA